MGLLRTAARAGVASSVHGRVHRRQQARWQEQSAPAAPPPAAPPPASPGPADDTQAQLDQLRQLGELRQAGVLTDHEFEAKKAKILLG